MMLFPFFSWVILIEFLGGGTFDFLTADDHFAHDFSHQRLSLVSCFLHFLVAYLNRTVEAAQVGNNADTKGADAAVVSYNNLGNGGHTNGVATQCAIHLIFCRSLERRTCGTHIDTVYQTDFLLFGNLCGQVDELVVVSLVHIREAWTCGEVLATQRMLGEEVDVVGDDHQVANLEGGVHATGSIRHEEGLDAQLVHDAYGERYFLHGVALVIVEAALHGHDVYTTKFTEDERTGVALDGRYGEVGDFSVRNLQLVSYF